MTRKITPNDLAYGIMTPNEARKTLGLKSVAVDDKVRTKSVATIEHVEDDTKYGPHGGFTAILSNARLDRDGEVWTQKEWVLPLPERITVDADHGMSVSTTIGSARPYFDAAGNLMMEASFSSIPRAQEVRTLIKEGHVGSVSVAALTDTSRKSGVPKRELLNAGVVAIPSNPDALILDAKSHKPDGVTIKVTPVIDAEALEQVTTIIKAATPGGGSDHALLQAIHDASVHLGANCADCAVCAANEAAAAQASADPTGASDGANTKNFEVDEKSFTLEEFKEAMREVISPTPVEDTPEVVETVEETPVVEPETPVEEAAAATEEVPAPVEETAVVEEPTAVEPDPHAVADHMLMTLFASNYADI